MNRASPPSTHDIGALVALVNQDRASEAEHKARALLALHPDAGMLWKILSVALLRQGKDALQALRRTTELMPRDAEAHGNLGAALHDRCEWTEALVSLRQALALQPLNGEAMVDAANALRALGRAGEAVPLYQRALQLEPRDAEARNNLGNAFLELHQYDEAVSCYREALAQRPGDARVLRNLGNTLRQLGRLDEAAASYQQALRLDPDSVDTLNTLGNVLRDLGARRESVPLYARAIELDPVRAESHCNLGTVLFEMRRVDEAVAIFRKALALAPDYAPAHLNLGLALRQQRRPDEAEISCRAALAIDPHYVEALVFLGELRADRGQFAEAEALFQRAIIIHPDFPIAYCSIATHRKMTDADTDWLRGAEALLAQPLALSGEISLRYALGKYFDDTRRYDEAFGHYHRANELTKRYGAKYNRAKLTERVDQIIRRFDAPSLQVFEAQGSSSELPIFIVGMPRSGTSLVEQILASHPAVFGAGEVIFWNAAYDANRNGAELPALSRQYLELLQSVSGAARRVVDKLPANFQYAGMIHAAFPQACIIHMQRHPIDTCLSIYFQNFFNIGPYANDLDNLAHFYGEYVRITDHWRAVLPASRLLEVPYEALIEDQEGWTRRMLDFVGLPWDPRCLDFQQTDRVVITASKWQVRQKIYSASRGRWTNYAKYIEPLNGLLKRESHAGHFAR
ncbi:MAG TPA: tetratricopeptide repeat protein [Steroidobacteraceae bacterium]